MGLHKLSVILLIAASLAAIPANAEEDELGLGTFQATSTVILNEENAALLYDAKLLTARIEKLEEMVEQLLNQGSAMPLVVSCGHGLLCSRSSHGGLLIEIHTR